MEPESDSLGLLLHDAQRAMRRAFDRRMGRFGLSSAQWRLLLHALREGEPTQARLADLLEIEPISVSRLIDRMEAQGWVDRKADANDRRVRLCCTNPMRDSSCESSMVAGWHEQTDTPDLQDQELAGL